MNTWRIRAWVLVGVFFVALALGLTQDPEGQRASAEESSVQAASLPILTAVLGEHRINPLRGYTTVRDEGVYAQSVYPLGESLEIEFHLIDGSERPRMLSYELRTEDGSRLIEKGENKDFTGGRADLGFRLAFQDLLEKEVLYRLRITVKLEGRTAYYYTRLLRTDSEIPAYLAEYGFTMHTSLYDYREARDYAAKLEPSDRSDRGTLEHVTINSSFDQFTWGDLEAKETSACWMTIEAANGNFAHLSFEYLVQTRAGVTVPVNFRVHENMTLQKYFGNVYVLNYDRYTEQLWEMNEETVRTDGFFLGIQNSERITQMKSPDEKVLAFTVAGELYSYSIQEQKLTCVYSFRHGREHELRTTCADYDMKLLSVSDNGDLEFALYGYFNGGRREGSCGLACYSYEAADGTLTETLFLESPSSYERLRKEVGVLFYRGTDNLLYFCLDEQIFVMDFLSGEIACLVNRAEFATLKVREDGMALAWESGGAGVTPRSLRVVNLKKGYSETLPAEEGEFIRLLGFLRNDLIIGRGRDGENVIFNGIEDVPSMYALEILDEELTQLLEYSFEDICLTGIHMDNEKITISRYRTRWNVYQYMEDDILLRSDDAKTTQASAFAWETHATLKRCARIPLAELPSALRILKTQPLTVLYGGGTRLPDSGTAQEERYFAYGSEEFLGSYASLGEAVVEAAAHYGYVTNRTDRVLWRWEEKKESAQAPNRTVGVSEGAMEVTGASLRDMLYFIHKDSPIRWISPDRGEQWILGYEWKNAIVYDADKLENYRIPEEEIAELITRNDNYLWAFDGK